MIRRRRAHSLRPLCAGGAIAAR